jgi:hypothetical protein
VIALVTDESSGADTPLGCALRSEDKAYGCALTGSQGTGKTSVMVQSCADDAADDRCCLLVFDPKRDLADKALSVIPCHRRTWILDLADPELGINPLLIPGRPDAVADAVVEGFRDTNEEGSILASSDRYLRQAAIGALVLARAEERPPSMGDVYRLLLPHEDLLRQRVAQLCDTDGELAFTSVFFGESLPGDLRDARSQTTAKLDAPRNKIEALLGVPSVNRMLHHPFQRSLHDIIAQRDVLVVRGATGAIGEGNAIKVLTWLLRCLDAALSDQQGKPEQQRVRVALKVDEAHLLFSTTFARMLAVHRTAGLEAMCAWQQRSQITDPAVREATTNLLQNRFAFRTNNADDALAEIGVMMSAYATVLHGTREARDATRVQPDMLINLDVHHALCSWIAGGRRTSTFVGRTIKPCQNPELIAHHEWAQRQRGAFAITRLPNLVAPDTWQRGHALLGVKPSAGDRSGPLSPTAGDGRPDSLLVEAATAACQIGTVTARLLARRLRREIETAVHLLETLAQAGIVSRPDELGRWRALVDEDDLPDRLAPPLPPAPARHREVQLSAAEHEPSEAATGRPGRDQPQADGPAVQADPPEAASRGDTRRRHAEDVRAASASERPDSPRVRRVRIDSERFDPARTGSTDPREVIDNQPVGSHISLERSYTELVIDQPLRLKYQPARARADDRQLARVDGRGRQILAVLHEAGFLMAPQLARRFWPPTENPRNVQRFLTRLVALGLLERFEIISADGGRHPFVYQLTKGGFDWAQTQHGPHGPLIHPDASWRDRNVSDPRYVLHHLRTAGWVLAFEAVAHRFVRAWHGPHHPLARPRVPRVKDQREWVNLGPRHLAPPPNMAIHGLQFPATADPGRQEFEGLEADALIELAIPTGQADRRIDVFVEMDRTRRPSKNSPKFRRYDHFITAWSTHLARYAEALKERPIVIFVCEDGDQARQFLTLADSQVTGATGVKGTQLPEWQHPARERMFFVAERDLHSGSLRALRLPRHPPQVRAALGEPRDPQPEQVSVLPRKLLTAPCGR